MTLNYVLGWPLNFLINNCPYSISLSDYTTVEKFESTSSAPGLAFLSPGLLPTHYIYRPSLHHITLLSIVTCHSPYTHLHTLAFPSFSLPPNTPSPHLFLCLWPTVAQFHPFGQQAPGAVSVNPDWSSMVSSFAMIYTFDLSNIVCLDPPHVSELDTGTRSTLDCVLPMSTFTMQTLISNKLSDRAGAISLNDLVVHCAVSHHQEAKLRSSSLLTP